MSNQLTPERIKELRDMIAGLPNNPWKGILFNDLLEALDTIEARNARIAELEAALKPFASDELHEGLDDGPDDKTTTWPRFRLGDFRSARAALKPKETAA